MAQVDPGVRRGQAQDPTACAGCQFAPPTKRFRYDGDPITTPGNRPQIRLDGRDIPEFHPILTTDFFEYGTSANRLDREGAAVEMGDAALGLACAELADPPDWAAIRNGV